MSESKCLVFGETLTTCGCPSCLRIWREHRKHRDHWDMHWAGMVCEKEREITKLKELVEEAYMELYKVLHREWADRETVEEWLKKYNEIMGE